MAGGGPSIFKQSLDLWHLTASLAIVIFATILFELAVHKCEHRFGKHQLYGPMLQKVMAEFTVLGFVSICTILAIQTGLVASLHVTTSVAEFEIAHIWIFFVGFYYVVMAFQNIKIAGEFTAKSHRWQMISKENLLSQLQNSSRRNGCGYFCCRRHTGSQRTGTDRIDQPEPAASSTLLGFYFRNAQREKIQEELGSRSRLFDFSVYEKHFFRHEMLTSLHVSLLSWIGFYLLFLCWVLLRTAGEGLIPDKTTLEGPGLAVWASLILWLAFIITVGIQEDRLDQFISTVVTGDKAKNTLCDALEHLVSISDNKATLDEDGTLWALSKQPEMVVAPEIEGNLDARAKTVKSIELTPMLGARAKEEGSGNYNAINQTKNNKNSWAQHHSLQQERQATLNRLRSVKQDQLKKFIYCSARVRQIVFNILLFCHCFAAGMYVFLIFPELFGYKEFMGRVAISSPSNHSSHSSSSSHRMLLGSSSSSSSGSGSDGSGVVWKTCEAFAQAGAEEHGRTALGGIQYRILDYEGHVGKDFLCTTQSSFGIIFSVLIFALPLILVEQMMPLFLGAHSRQKNVMLACKTDDSDAHSNSHHEHENQHHGDGHHGRHCCMDLLFGHDHADFNSIISEVCEKFLEQSHIVEEVQNNALLALQLYPEGFDDLRKALHMNVKAPPTKAPIRSSIALMGSMRKRALRVKWGSKRERKMTKDQSAMWNKDEANGWPKMKALVQEFLKLLRELKGRGGGGSSNNAKKLSISDYVAGLNLLYKHRLPESGRKLRKKVKVAFSKSFNRDANGDIKEKEFQNFLIHVPCNTARPSIIGAQNPAFEGNVQDLQESLHRALQRIKELEHR